MNPVQYNLYIWGGGFKHMIITMSDRFNQSPLIKAYIVKFTAIMFTFNIHT